MRRPPFAGTVGVQLTDGSRVFSQQELQSALAAAAAKPPAPNGRIGSGGAGSGPIRILPRGTLPSPPRERPAAPEPAIPAADLGQQAGLGSAASSEEGSDEE